MLLSIYVWNVNQQRKLAYYFVVVPNDECNCVAFQVGTDVSEESAVFIFKPEAIFNSNAILCLV
jgi:hypothetical protein